MDVSIIGGAGHVGLPLGIVLADSGFSVTLIDEDRERLNRIDNGVLPFHEPGGQALLKQSLAQGRLHTTDELAVAGNSDVIFVVIGTPIDEHHNPQMDTLLDVVNELVDHLSDDQLLIFRSTLYPGTTNNVCSLLKDNDLYVGDDVYVSFAPERIAQHNAFEEIVELPQLVGAPDEESYARTKDVFETILEAEVLRLTPTEAELGKLFTNMWRYLTFAAANEFYLIADTFATHHEVNIHRILDRTKQDYPRFDAPSPGANVGGPCLTKDGWFLVDNIPYNELVSASYHINEGIPAQIVQRMATIAPNPDKVTILGMTFKRNSDDTRNSVSFKLEKQLQMKGYTDVVRIEPNVQEFDEWEKMAESDWVIVMTPHKEFDELEAIRNIVDNDDCLYCDIWGLWDEIKYRSDNGYFFDAEVDDVTQTSMEVQTQ